ncbi:MAG: tRNA (adenosine(37)-N6)-threonylcarbamoyltransferase complex transferase subunit TsaD, partial [[Eubacterium] sulci]|nr:tRNA (adenosine(37)-N6)-threonylcarbamoyltransferase complex transferase subunit TsaD [[Eubacterium] sulci]
MPRNISCEGDKFLTLSIESSCDETAAAVLANGRELLS